MAKRRGHGEGSIFQRKSDGMFCAEIVVVEASGRKRKRRRYAKTKTEARDKLRTMQQEAAAGLDLQSCRALVAPYLEEQFRRSGLKATTLPSYLQHLRCYISPTMGQLRLEQVTAAHVDEMLAAMASRRLSAATRRGALAVLRRGMRIAVRKRHIRFDPTDGVEAPKVRRPEVHPLNPGESKALQAAARRAFAEAHPHGEAHSRGDRLGMLYVLALRTGMRLGEMLALQWTDVDFTRRRIAVQANLAEVMGLGLQRVSTKTGKRRSVSLDAATVRALREQRERVMVEGLAASPWVFPASRRRGDGKLNPVRKSNVIRRSFKPLLKRAGLHDIRFHDLRHTHASLMIAQGANPKVIQERLGHASITITLDVYGHLFENMQVAAVDRLAEVLGE